MWEDLHPEIYEVRFESTSEGSYFPYDIIALRHDRSVGMFMCDKLVFTDLPEKDETIYRPKEKKIGQFGAFWDSDKEIKTWGILRGIVNDQYGRFYQFGDDRDWEYANFEPGLPKGFDSEGNPIEG